MYKAISIITICAVILMAIYLILNPTLGSQSHSLPPGPIRDLEVELPGSDILILSGEETIYSVHVQDWTTNYQIYTDTYHYLDIIQGNPQGNLIYSAALNNVLSTVVCLSIDKTSQSVMSCDLPSELAPQRIAQDENKLYVSCGFRAPGDSMKSKVVVITKSNMAITEIWDVDASPPELMFDSPVYDPATQTLLLEDQYPIPWKEGPGTTADYGVHWESRITRYDPARSGTLIESNKVEGHARGLAIMNDGAVIVGLLGDRINYEPAATLAIIKNGINYVTIGQYHVNVLDYDAQTNRVFATLRDYELDQSSSNILVWDYDTLQYNLIDSGVQGLSVLRYMGEKLYASTGKDDNIYVIDIG